METQLFNDELDTVNFYNIFKYSFFDKNNESSIAAYKSVFFDDCYNSYSLADILYGKYIASLAMTQEEWRKGFDKIISKLNRVGTFEYYLEIMHGLYGNDVEVKIYSADNQPLPPKSDEYPYPLQPGQVLIDIDGEYSYGYSALTANDLKSIEAQDNSMLVYSQIKDNISLENLNKVFQSIKPEGIITFIYWH
jgi:hypothetical protein